MAAYPVLVYVVSRAGRQVSTCSLHEKQRTQIQDSVKYANKLRHFACIVTNFFVIKPNRCPNFTNLYFHETLHVSESSSAHHQGFIHCTLSNGTVCPTRYRTRHFFNHSNTNEDIATKFEQEYVRCVRNEEECVCSVCL